MFSGGLEWISGIKWVIKNSGTPPLIWSFLLIKLLVRKFENTYTYRGFLVNSNIIS